MILAYTQRDAGCEIEHECILPSFLQELHCDPLFHPSHHDSSDTEADTKNPYIQPVHTSLQISIYCNPELDNSLAGTSITNEYCDVFDND